MSNRKVKDAVDTTTNELIYFKGHARSTYMSDGANVEDAIRSVSLMACDNMGIDLSSYYTKNEIDAMGFLREYDIETKQDIIEDLDEIRYNAEIGASAAIQSASTEYVTEAELQTGLSQKSNIDHTHEEYLTKTVYYGDVLFDESLANFNTSITLTNDVSNYKFIDIEFATDDNHISHSRVYDPNGKIVTLTVALFGQNSFFMKARTYKIEGNTLTTATVAGTGTESGKQVAMAGLWGTHNSGTMTRGESFIGICKIVGYK